MKETVAVDERHRDSPVMSIAEYRKLMNDYASTDERIIERLEYLYVFCRNIIRMELEKYLSAGRKN